MGARVYVFIAATLLLLLLLLLPWLCCHPNRDAPPDTQPFDEVVTGSFDAVGAPQVTALPSDAYRCCWKARWPGGRRLPTPIAMKKIDAVLAAWLADSSATKVETLLVSYIDPVKIPRFPNPDVQQSRTSVSNLAALTQASVLIHSVAAARASQYNADSLDLVSNYGAQVLESYWITQALRITMPLGKVDSLALVPHVVWIQRDRTTMPPPGFDTASTNDPIEARTKIGSDHYFDLGLSYGWVSVLDTGVRRDHVLFAGSPSPFNRVGDCVDGDVNCVGGDPADVTKGHGTSSAGILAANNPAYARWRGVTAARLDVFRVYRPYGEDAELVASAAIRGFQTATALLDRVIVAEIQDNSTDAAAIADAAEGAFEAGSTVIAANGNLQQTQIGTMSYPASARRVIGVGARHILAPHPTIASQSYGRTADRRQKPDLQTLSLTKSGGSSAIDTDYILSGTSGATPYAAGSAALLRNWLTMARGGLVDPGQVYAQLLLSGTNVGPAFPDKEGVGQILLPSGGSGKFGKIRLSTCCRECLIPIDLGTGNFKQLHAALWWPEELLIENSTAVDTHNDIDLHLIDPQGVERGSSVAADGVFERAVVDVPATGGVWYLKIDGKSFHRLPQDVYWTVALKK